MAAVQSEVEADRAELLPNQSRDSRAVRDCRREREAPRFRSFGEDKELSGCQQLREEKASAGDPINTTKDHISWYIFTHTTVNVSIASPLCSVSTNTICPGVISSCDCTVGKDKVYTACDADVKELIFIDCICDIWLFDKALVKSVVSQDV